MLELLRWRPLKRARNAVKFGTNLVSTSVSSTEIYNIRKAICTGRAVVNLCMVDRRGEETRRRARVPHVAKSSNLCNIQLTVEPLDHLLIASKENLALL